MSDSKVPELLQGALKFGIKPGLERITNLMNLLGNPQDSFRSVHIAGTNGKGSCSHTLAAILQSAGYKVGLYTSPHLVDFRERIRINGTPVSEAYVIDFVENHRAFFEPLHPSFFELTTAMAFNYFAEEQVDIAVIEVGLGGRLDCTNIIHPDMCVITNISFDHVQFLGDTLSKIASEKAGIIKPGIPVVIGKNRAITGKYAVEKLGAEVIIMDDGYQHWHLERDLDVVLVDTLNMFGNGCVLPRGMLREPLENLDRGDLFLLTKTDQSSILSRMQLRKTIEKYNTKAPVVESVHHPKNFVEIADWYKGITQNHMDLSELEGKNVMVFSAIGNPSSFEQTLSGIGLNIKEAVRYPDHHDYGMLEMQYISERASSHKAVAMVTTSKDAVKIPTEFIYSSREIPLYILNMDIQVTEGFDKFKECVIKAIQKEKDK